MLIRKYRLAPSGFLPAMKRRARRRLLWLLPFVVLQTVVLLVLFFRARGLELPWWVFPLALTLVAGALLAPLPFAMKRGRQSWNAYELTVSRNVLHLHMGAVPPIEIVRPEVSRVVESKGEGLLVHSRDAGRRIFIPEEIQDFDGVRQHLRSWREIERPSVGRERLLGGLGAVILFVCMATTAVAADIRIASGAGAVVIALLVLFVRQVLRVKAADNRVKANQLVVLGLCAVLPVYRLVSYVLFQSM